MDFEIVISELTEVIHRQNDLFAAEEAGNAALLEQVKIFTERIERVAHIKDFPLDKVRI